MKMKIVLLTIFLAAVFVHPAAALDVKEKNPAGTEYADGLTDKQLAIQRWFAELTFLNDGSDVWDGWFRDKSQLGLDSYRYSLAFLGYAAGASAYKTPAYTELAGDILDDSIRRMIRKEVWDYIKTYWKKEPTFPDPVVWENIMYSGHLMQLIALYESLTGDMKYSQKGWDFVWDDKTRIHYDAKKLMKVVYDQVEKDERGGVPCEPDTIFVICNDHPQNAFRLYDAMHGTKFAALGGKWEKWMKENAPLPKMKGKDYLKISYLRDRKMWTAGFGTPGSDGWALAWMYPWISDTGFVCRGWKTMFDNSSWRRGKDGGWYLRATAVAKIFGVDDSSGTSFYPLVEAQCIVDGDKARGPEVFTYFEAVSGKFADLDGDGMKESYYYDTEDRTRLWVTANLAAAMVTKGNSLRRMYEKPFFIEHKGEPFLAHADYPNVMVKKAEYVKARKTLEFTLVKGSAKLKGETELTCGNIKKIKSVSRNGKPFKGWKLKSGKLTIKTRVDGETAFKVVVE